MCACLHGKQDDSIGVCVGCNKMMTLACGLGACVAVDEGSLAEQRAWDDGVRGLGILMLGVWGCNLRGLRL